MRGFCAAILGLILFGSAQAAEPVASRILRVFDFEERRLGNPEELPMHWAKVEGPGMPHYVDGQLATDRARGGKYSFRFDLNGGSLVYRYDAKRIKVQPRSNYRVEGYVRQRCWPMPGRDSAPTLWISMASQSLRPSSIPNSTPLRIPMSPGSICRWSFPPAHQPPIRW
jgi:hypothetical protein